MKKLVLFFVAVVAVSFASCGGAKTEAAANVDSTAIEVIETVVDSVVVDSVATDSVAVAQ
ncbi:MAG: PG1828 family lipoprotein [Bacteroidales bacterium]